ncbi:MAG TPA: hypothetical protein VNF73_04620 [Candidatus Saccharimonadales bacterium]|nr:hypothetical protein [Candidatus Saccharimonadales bacterium]HVC32780.1 hypothetical protein [Chloroflexota bacterium]
MMLLWAVVIQDLRQARLERVVLLAAERSEDAEAMARALFQAEGKPPELYQFSAQPFTEVSGPGSTQYRITLHRLRPRRT